MKTAAFLLLAIGIGLTILNWSSLFASWFSKRHISPVFPASSLLTAWGLALFEPTRAYCWVSLLTDYTLFTLLIAAPALVADEWRTSRFTRVKLLLAEETPRKLELSLHRGGHFLLRATFIPPAPCDKHGACIRNYGAVGRWQDTVDGRLRLWGYREQCVLTLEPEETDYVAREEHYPEGKEFRYDALEGVRFRTVE